MRILEPRKPLKFRITKKHIQKAKKADPCYCVIAQALADSPREVLSCEVNATITTVCVRGAVERYATPKHLRTGLENWDNTGFWSLPEGDYQLDPVAKSQTKKVQREAARKRRAAGDPNMFHDRSIYPARKRNLSARAIQHRELIHNKK